MRLIDLYLRKGKVYAIANRGLAGYVGGNPIVADATLEGFSAAIAHGLATWTPNPTPHPDAQTAVPSIYELAGVKTWGAFKSKAEFAKVREQEDGYAILRGQPIHGGFQSNVVETLPRDAPIAALAEAVLRAFRDEE